MSSLHDAAADIAQHCLAFRIRKLNRKMTRIYNEALKPFRLQVSQVNMLTPLAFREDQGMSPAQLLEILEMDKSTLSRNMNVLVKRDLVEMVPLQQSTQQIIYRLTQKGREVMGQVHPAWAKANHQARTLFRELSQELNL